MYRSVPFIALAIGILGQFAAYFLGSAFDAFLIPWRDNQMPKVPEWYFYTSPPISFLVMLLPAFLCGFYVASRPILVGTVAAGVGTLLWRWLGNYTIAQLFPARPLGGVGALDYAFSVLSSPKFLATLAIYTVCYGVAGAAAASGGYLLRNRVRPNLSLNRTVAGGRPSAPAGTAG